MMSCSHDLKLSYSCFVRVYLLHTLLFVQHTVSRVLAQHIVHAAPIPTAA